MEKLNLQSNLAEYEKFPPISRTKILASEVMSRLEGYKGELRIVELWGSWYKCSTLKGHVLVDGGETDEISEFNLEYDVMERGLPLPRKRTLIDLLLGKPGLSHGEPLVAFKSDDYMSRSEPYCGQINKGMDGIVVLVNSAQIIEACEEVSNKSRLANIAYQFKI